MIMAAAAAAAVVVVVVVVVVTCHDVVVVDQICRRMVTAVMRVMMVTAVHISRRWCSAGAVKVIHIKDGSDFSKGDSMR
jgi:hypothetical protein